MNLKTLLTTCLMVFLLAGCTNGSLDVLKTAETGVHIKLLDAEFDQAVAAIESMPLNEYEATEMGAVIDELRIERDRLRTLHRQGAGRIVLSSVKSQATLDDVTELVVTGRQVFMSHIERTGEPISPLLKSYYESAVIARTNIQSAIDSGAGVSAGELAQYFGLALRTIAAVNGVPL